MAKLGLDLLRIGEQAEGGAVEAAHQQLVHRRLQSTLVLEDADDFPRVPADHVPFLLRNGRGSAGHGPRAPATAARCPDLPRTGLTTAWGIDGSGTGLRQDAAGGPPRPIRAERKSASG